MTLRAPDVINFIIFSGDVAFSGQSKEYKVAKKEFFKPILEACGNLSSDKLFIVPGNHDLDITKIKMLPVPLLKPLESNIQAKDWLFEPEKRSEALKPFKAFASFVSRYTHQKNPNYANIRRFEIDGKNIALIGLNSAWMCGRRKNSINEYDDKGAAVVGEPQIYDVVEAISESDIKIAVLHHPFEWLADFESSQIMHRLIKRCDFILRGHQHEQQVTVINSTYGDCIVIPAGACYNRRNYANAYNFVHLDFNSGKGIVFMRCWNERDDWREDIDSSPEGKFEFIISKFIPNNAEPKKLDAAIIEPVNIIGREEQVDDFSKLISDFDHAQVICNNVLLISIWGFGGVGKTTLMKKFGEICDSDKWFITGMASIQTLHPDESLSVFLSRIHRFQNEPDADEFETISKFVASLPSRSALLVDEFRSDDKHFVDLFEWMISQMATQANHRYLIITTCRPRPRFRRVQVVHYIGAEHGLPPLTMEETQEYLDLYWKGNPINKYINKIFRVTHGNPKRLNYLFADHKIYEKVLLYSDSSVLDEESVIQATWEYIYNTEDLRRIADLAAIVGIVSTECPNDIFDQMIENWIELKKSMLDRSLLEQVRSDTYKIHDLLLDYYYKNMRNTDKKQQHQKVGDYYENDENQPVEALEHYLRAEDKESIRRVYRPAYKVMERNSDYKKIIRLIGKQIDIFGANDEFGVDVVTDRGMSYRILSDYQSALSDFEQALSICNFIDVPENSSKRAKIFWGLGETYRRLDRYEKSLEFYDKGLVIYRTHENEDGKDGIAKSERGKSAVYKMISRYQESIQGYIAAGNLYRRMKNLDGQLYCERGIAAVYMLQGLYIQAREGYAHSLQLYRTTKNPRGIAYASWGYAESLRLKSDIETAIETYKDALKLSKEIGDDWSIFYLSLNLGECYRAKRDFKKARGWHESDEET